MDFRKIKDYIPLISICLLYFGFCNIYSYYKEFNVEIYSYVTNTDILLSFFPKIVVLTSFIYTFLLNQLYQSIRKPVVLESNTGTNDVSLGKSKKRLDWWQKNIYWFIIFYYMFVNLFTYAIGRLFKYKSYELSDWNLCFDFIFLILIYIAIQIHEKKSSFYEKPFFLALLLILFIGLKIDTYRKEDARKIKDGKSEYLKDHLSFKYKDSLVKTNDSVLFIGQTATYIFLYSVKDSLTHIYPLANVQELKVK